MTKATLIDHLYLPVDLIHLCGHDEINLGYLLGISKEINPKIVQEQLGHSSINPTLNTYSHVIKSMWGITADALEDVVRSD